MFIEKFVFESMNDLIEATLFHIQNYAKKNQLNELEVLNVFSSVLKEHLEQVQINKISENKTIDSYLDTLCGDDIYYLYRITRELFDVDPFSEDKRSLKEALKEVIKDEEKWSHLTRVVCAVRMIKNWGIEDFFGYTDLI